MGGLREQKKRETRQRISDVATKLFYARGFEAVPLDEVAVAAQVSKMTVLNYFARKEELLLDREDDLKLLPFRQALRDRRKGQAPVDALRDLVASMDEREHSLAHVDKHALNWWRIVSESPSLQARLRELADEAAEGVALELAGPQPDGHARLVAGLIVLTVRTAREEALRILQRGASAKKANAAFRELMERGLSAAEKL